MVDVLNWFVHNWGWVFLFFCLGGGALFTSVGKWILEFIDTLFGGHHKRARLKERVKALERENERLTAILGGKETPAIQDRTMVAENARMLHLLGQVQASDRAMPQLPQETRDEIDDVLSDHFGSRRGQRDVG